MLWRFKDNKNVYNYDHRQVILSLQGGCQLLLSESAYFPITTVNISSKWVSISLYNNKQINIHAT